MAGEQEPPARVEVEVARPQSTSVEPDSGTAVQRDLGSTTVELDQDGGLGPTEEAQTETGEATTTATGEPGEKGTSAEALPDYDPDNPEVAEKYDAKFFTEDGSLSLSALTQEFDTNAAAGEGTLNAGTYAYLKDRLGLDEAACKQIEQGQVALREAGLGKFYAGIEGGKEAYEKAIEWGRGGGYTEAQREAFNAAQKQGGQTFEDAVEALMGRYRRANPGETTAERRGPKGAPRRSSSPQRDVTGGAQTGGGGPAGGDRFANPAEHTKAWSAVLQKVTDARRGGDRAAINAAVAEREAVRAKAKLGYREG